MKLAIVCLCILPLAFVSGGIFTRHNLQSKNLSQASQKTGSLNQSRQRTLFARRGQYEQQRIRERKPKVKPTPPKNPVHTKVDQKPAEPSCSQLGQSCLPQAGCCVPCGKCHCHFFNAICFCMKINLQCKKKI